MPQTRTPPVKIYSAPSERRAISTPRRSGGSMPRSFFSRKRFLPALIVVSLSVVLSEDNSAMQSSVIPWYDSAWGYRAKITVSSVMTQGGPFLDFPMVVRLGAAQSSLFARSKPNGADLVITKGDGTTVLPRELVTFDPARQFAEIWVRADTLSSSRRDFYIYYGNTLASVSSSNDSTWPPAYLAVYHFDDDPGTGIAFDSSPHHNDGHAGFNANFTSADSIRGVVGQGWNFNGTTHWLEGTGIATPDSSYTISAWFACWHLEEDANFAFTAEQGFWHLSAKRNPSQKVPDAVMKGGSFSWPPNPLPD